MMLFGTAGLPAALKAAPVCTQSGLTRLFSSGQLRKDADFSACAWLTKIQALSQDPLR